MKKELYRIVSSVLILIGVLYTGPALAVDYVVNISDNTLNGHSDADPDPATLNCVADGGAGNDCSLREAIMTIDAAGGTHTIALPADTITLTRAGAGDNNGDLDIDTTASIVTINGVDSSSSIIDAGGATVNDRILSLSESSSTVTFNDVYLTGGDNSAQGAVLDVLIGATLNINNSIISGNSSSGSGGAIQNNGTLNLDATELSSNYGATSAGAIRNLGTLNVTDSYFANNSTDTGSNNYNGGAILNNPGGVFTIEHSTFYNNSAHYQGGAIQTFCSGNTNYVSNSTFVSNTATKGGAINVRCSSGATSSDAVTIAHSTFYNNTASSLGGAIAVGDDGNDDVVTVDVWNSIFTDNTENSVSDVNCNDSALTTPGSAFTSSDYNIDSATSCGFAETNDLASTDPLLETAGLEDNGGSVHTIGLQSGSPALDIVPPASCLDAESASLVIDARGNTRPINTNCDVGAVERDQTAPVVSITAGTDTIECNVDTWTDSGATATDTFDTTVTASTTDTVDESSIGNQTVTYTATDYDENSDTDDRTVTVEDTTAPVITVTGDVTQILEAGSDTYTEQGAAVAESCDTTLTSATVGGDTVDVDTLGSYTVTYNATDASSYAGVQKSRTVTVADTTAPVITLLGDSSAIVIEGETYTDDGVTAADVYNGDVTTTVVTVNPVDTAILGTYVITYNVTDSSNNNAIEVTRTITVEDNIATPKTVTELAKTDGTLTVTYEDSSTDEFEPYSGKKNFKYVASEDNERVVTYNGKQVKVFVNGEETAKKSMRKKKPTKKKHYKLKVQDVFTDKSYETISVMSVKKKNASVGVLRLTEDHLLKKKKTKDYKVEKKNTLKLNVKVDTNKVVATFGTGSLKDKRTYKIKNKGKLKRVN